jgi:spore coat protein U-like protein
MDKRKYLASLTLSAGLFALCMTNGVLANSTTGSLTVQATVAKNCVLTSGSLNFGAYDPVVTHATSDLDGSGTFTIACTKNAAATLSLGLGLNASGAQTRLSDGASNFLNYNLYTTSLRTVIWNATNTVAYTALTKNPFTETVYGRIPQAQDVPGATYNDTVTITATFTP